jgi:hypothetical protein
MVKYSWSSLGLAVHGRAPKDVADALVRLLPQGAAVTHASVTLEAIEKSRATIVSAAVNDWCAVMVRWDESPLLAVDLSRELACEVLGFESHADCPEIVRAINGEIRRHRLEGDEYVDEGEPQENEPDALSFDAVREFVERVSRPFLVEVGDPVLFVDQRR